VRREAGYKVTERGLFHPEFVAVRVAVIRRRDMRPPILQCAGAVSLWGRELTAGTVTTVS